MLINLVMKDFMLVKKYFLILLVFAAIAPIYISTQIQLNDGGLTGFLLTVILMEHILFSTISKFEDPVQGSRFTLCYPIHPKRICKSEVPFSFCNFYLCSYYPYNHFSCRPIGYRKP
ncbi:ABC-2 transporter permease [Bacillus anthracis]|uniref:ABC-2 transporter permease n=1 Tax=Bacillus anthracis TaxID=1392 RepID=UPI003B98466B